MEGWRKDARHEPIIVDLEALVPTERGKEIYAMRKQTIERVFADAKEKHALRYTHHRGLARVSAWVRLKYAAMNLKFIDSQRHPCTSVGRGSTPPAVHTFS